MKAIADPGKPFKVEGNNFPSCDYLKEKLKAKEVNFFAEGFYRNSDYAINGGSGQLKYIIVYPKGQVQVQLEFQPFTGNCGVKAISHLGVGGPLDKNNYISHPSRLPNFNEVWFMFENWLLWIANAGTIVASGPPGFNIHDLFANDSSWYWSKPQWNPTYTWDRDHTITVGTHIVDISKHSIDYHNGTLYYDKDYYGRKVAAINSFKGNP